VMVSYDVEVDGSLSSVALVRSSGVARLDDAALWCVSTLWRNTPAIDHGKPVRSAGHRAVVRFTLDHGAQETALDFSWRGYGHLESGEYGDALKALTQSIAMDGSSGDTYFYRGLVELMLGDNARAHDDFEQAARLKVKLPDMADWTLLADWAAANQHPAVLTPPRTTNRDGI